MNTIHRVNFETGAWCANNCEGRVATETDVCTICHLYYSWPHPYVMWQSSITSAQKPVERKIRKRKGKGKGNKKSKRNCKGKKMK